jgi:CMP/dCMP kinase
MKLKNNLQIAIDGPLGAGKSVTAKLLSKRLNILYVYTGAMYRATALLGLQNGLDLKQETPLVKLLSNSKIELFPSEKSDKICKVLLNGIDVSDLLFSPELSRGASQVGIFPKIRQILVKKQQEIANNQAVVMEGRDIAVRVLPQADLKIYMTADVNIRAKRRWRDLIKQGFKVNLSEVIAETEKRDYQDSHRQTDPLKIVTDAWVLDTSKLTIEKTVDAIIDKLLEKKLIEI